MSITISKTDYLVYRDCPKNAWLKKHRPEVYFKTELASFEKLIIETGNEVEKVARTLFPTGVLIKGHDEAAIEETQKKLGEGVQTLFQPIFHKENFLAAVDVLKFDEESGEYTICEIKATSEADEKTHYYDLAFQTNLLRMSGLNVTTMSLLHLNSDYVREGDIDVTGLFTIEDVTLEIESMIEEVAGEMESALAYISNETEPTGSCTCIYKGRSKHCVTFDHSNPEIPAYGVHDIARIGSSKAKLRELIDSNIFEFENIPDGMKFSDTQQNQIDAHVLDRATIDRENIREELSGLSFPLYFLDYETFPSAIPLYDGFSPYQQIPFQYSLHILRDKDAKLEHREFLYTEAGDPSKALFEAMQKDIGSVGSVIVWNKSFERGRNEEIAQRIPEARAFMDSVNSRLYDLMDVFKKQFYVHKDFKGSTSIKKILPVLAPELSYKTLGIQEGGTAAESWNKMIIGSLSIDEKKKIATDLKEYCGLDSFAMYEIWRVLDAM
ncbi:MAG: DUF2779 domain-containing protein [Patescibacteria group bacterium]